MPTEIVHHLSPEEQELARKRQELTILQAELTDRELFLANLRAELAAFEGRYLREVGVLYAELDDWNAKIAEFAAEAAGTEHRIGGIGGKGTGRGIVALIAIWRSISGLFVVVGFIPVLLRGYREPPQRRHLRRGAGR